MAGIVLGSLGVLVAAVSIVAARRLLFVVTVQGGSMEPSLLAGDRLLARRVTIAGIRRGDVVVLERPDGNLRWTRPPGARAAASRGRLLIKRVAAVSGEAPPRRAAPALADHPAELVPPGHLVAFGDNFRDSFDSKQIGYFPADRVVGVVVRHLRRPVRG